MPLTPGASEATKKHNIEEMVKAGHPVKQAVAAALHNADKYADDEIPEGIEPAFYAKVHDAFARAYPHFHAAYLKHCGG